MEGFFTLFAVLIAVNCDKSGKRPENSWKDGKTKSGNSNDEKRSMQTIRILTVPSTNIMASPCQSNPCKDGKICTEIEDGYKCTCPRGRICDGTLGRISGKAFKISAGKPLKQAPTEADIIISSFKPSVSAPQLSVNNDQPTVSELDRETESTATALLANNENQADTETDEGERIVVANDFDKALGRPEVENLENAGSPINVIGGVTEIQNELDNGGDGIPLVDNRVNNDEGGIDDENNDDYEGYNPTASESDSINELEAGRADDENEMLAPTPLTDDDIYSTAATARPPMKQKKLLLIMKVRKPSIIKAPNIYPGQHFGINMLAKPCDPNPCQNNGSCHVQGDSAYSCNCPGGYSGKHCMVVVMTRKVIRLKAVPVLPTPPTQDGPHIPVLPLPIQVPETGGAQECSPNPCQQGGTCLVDIYRNRKDGSFFCVCRAGFTGRICGCSTAPGSVCNETENKELTLPLEHPCTGSPCKEGGTCLVDIFRNRSDGSFVCVCRPGYTGRTCQCPTAGPSESNPCKEEEDKAAALPEDHPCRSNPCEGGGTCIVDIYRNRLDGSYKCVCREGLTGNKCQCSDQEERCFDEDKVKAALEEEKLIGTVRPTGPSVSYPTPAAPEPLKSDNETDAESEVEGEAADLEIGSEAKGEQKPTEAPTECDEDNKSNGCEPKFVYMIKKEKPKIPEGMKQCGTCEHEEDESPSPELTACHPNPCLNGGTCHAFNNNGDEFYSCICPVGYEGSHCEEISVNNPNVTVFEVKTTRPPSDAMYKPTQPGVTTAAKPPHLVMMSKTVTNTTEPESEEEQNHTKYIESFESTSPCIPNPCLNGGTCHAFENGEHHYYSCTCPEGFVGDHCQGTVNVTLYKMKPKIIGPTPIMSSVATNPSPTKSVPITPAMTTAAPSTTTSKIAGPFSWPTGSPNADKVPIVPGNSETSSEDENPCLESSKTPEEEDREEEESKECKPSYVVMMTPKPTAMSSKQIMDDATEEPNPCLPNPCKNGGTCHAFYNGDFHYYSCICPVGFEGTHCQEDVCAECHFFAICPKGKCKCKFGYIGDGYDCINATTKIGEARDFTEFSLPTRRPTTTAKYPATNDAALNGPRKCNVIADIGFILDSSGSIWKNYDDEKEFLKTLATAFGVKKNGSHAGVVTFSTEAEHSIKLDDHEDLIEFSEAVDSIRHMGGTTRIDLAVKEIKKNMFLKKNGGRTGVKKMVILLTDGVQTGATAKDPQSLISDLQDDGITVIVIGVGNMDVSKLMRLAGEENFYYASNFTVLNSDDFVRKITGDSCEKVNAAPVETTCPIDLDVAFVLDSSGSIRKRYGEEKKFVKTLASMLGLNTKGTHAGVVLFSSRAKIKIKLTDHTDLFDFNYAMDNLPHIGGGTRIDRALKEVDTKFFTTKNGARNNVQKLVVLVTDGEQKGGKDPGVVAERLRDDGVAVFVIGVGKVNESKLEDIAGKGNYYLASNFSELNSDSFVGNFTKDTCHKVTLQSKKPKCTQLLDVGFVLDSSASIRKKYGREKDFLKTFAKSLGVGGKSGSRAGVVTFSSKAKLSIKLKDHLNLKEFSKAVDAIPHMNGRTKINRALKLVRKKMFLEKNGARKDAEKLIVLITDGEQTGAGDPELASKRIRDSGIHFIVVGIGKLNSDKLRSIAGKGNWMLASNFSTLNSQGFVDNITKVACNKVNNPPEPKTEVNDTAENKEEGSGSGSGAPHITVFNINLARPRYVFNGLELQQSPTSGQLYGICPQYGGRVIYEIEQVTPDELISLIQPLSSNPGSAISTTPPPNIQSCQSSGPLPVATTEYNQPPPVPTFISSPPVLPPCNENQSFEIQNSTVKDISLPLILRNKTRLDTTDDGNTEDDSSLEEKPPLDASLNTSTTGTSQVLYNESAPTTNTSSYVVTNSSSQEGLAREGSERRALPDKEEDTDFFNFDDWKALSSLSKDIGCKKFLDDLLKYRVIQNSAQFRKAGEQVSIFCPVDSAYLAIKALNRGREKSILLNHVAARLDKCGSVYKSLYPNGKIFVTPRAEKRDKTSWKANGIDILVSLVDEDGNEIVIIKDVLLPVEDSVIDVIESRKDTSAFYEMWRKSNVDSIFMVPEIKKVCFVNNMCIPLSPSMRKTLHDAARLQEFTIVVPTNPVLKSMGTRKLGSVMKNSKTVTKFLQDFIFLGSLESPNILHKETAYSLSSEHDMLTLGFKGNYVTLTDDSNQEFKVKETVRVMEGILHIVE